MIKETRLCQVSLMLPKTKIKPLFTEGLFALDFGRRTGMIREVLAFPASSLHDKEYYTLKQDKAQE